MKHADEASPVQEVVMPPAGCMCHRCGYRYTVDLLVPDDVWEQIALPPAKMLCGPCIMARIEDTSGFAAWKLVAA